RAANAMHGGRAPHEPRGAGDARATGANAQRQEIGHEHAVAADARHGEEGTAPGEGWSRDSSRSHRSRARRRLTASSGTRAPAESSIAATRSVSPSARATRASPSHGSVYAGLSAAARSNAPRARPASPAARYASPAW